MTHFFARLFNVRADEWPRLLLLYLMALVALTGINWGETIVIAAFLQQIGVNFLPLAIIASAALSIVTAPSPRLISNGIVKRWTAVNAACMSSGD